MTKNEITQVLTERPDILKFMKFCMTLSETERQQALNLLLEQQAKNEERR